MLLFRTQCASSRYTVEIDNSVNTSLFWTLTQDWRANEMWIHAFDAMIYKLNVRAPS